MREQEFRNRVHAVLGDAPDGPRVTQRAAAILRRPPAAEERTGPPRAMALVAAALAVLVLAGLLGPRLLRAAPHGASPATGGGAPAPARSPSPSQSPSNLATCRLPVVVSDFHAATSAPGADPTRTYPSPLPGYTAGFVSPATGRFVADPSAQAGTMPFRRNYVNDEWSPVSYDPVLKRWLPAGRNQVSPDHRSYLYTTQSPLATGKGSKFDSSTLHVYDVTTGGDRVLWTSTDQIDPGSTWDAGGIHTFTIPWTGGHPTYWVVDPATGAVAASQGPPSTGVPLVTGWGMGTGAGYGTDGEGRPILLAGTRDPGAHQEYFVGGPNGQRIVIHDGRMGDSFDFDPNGFTPDGDRLWAVNYDATALWLWTEKDGLKRIALTGIAQHDQYVSPEIVGPCV